MRKSAKQLFHRGLAFLMTALVLFGTLGVSPIPVHAADGTLEYRTGKKSVMAAILRQKCLLTEVT